MRSPATARRLLRPTLAASSVVAGALLSGCPQLLDDGFRPEPTGLGGGGGDAGSGADRGGGARAGEAGSGGSSLAGGDDGDASVSASAPRVLESRPAAGERGVARDASVELRFSQPMDPVATEAAYVSSDLPADDVELSWSDADRVLLVRPREPLVYASGAAPLAVEARSYSLGLTSAARDTTGRALEPFNLTFSTARELVVTIPIVGDSTSSGKYRSDGTDGVSECATAQQTVCVGVGATAGNPSYRGFATFDLSGLPGEHLGLSLAELSLTLSVLYGTPFATLGPLLIESVRFDAVGASAFAAAASGEATAITALAALNDTANVDVLPAVRADAAQGTRSQFRLRFTGTAVDDGGPDLIGLLWPTTELRVGYLLP